MMQDTPNRFIAHRNSHKQGVMEWQGEKIKVDEGLQPLLLAFNRFDQIATVSSCIGGKLMRGYVSFRGDQPAVVRRLLSWMLMELRDLDVDVEYRSELKQGCLRWETKDLPALIKAIEAMQQGIAERE